MRWCKGENTNRGATILNRNHALHWAWTPFYGLGAIISHWVAGILRDVTGVYTYSFWINAIMAGLSFILISRLEKRTDQAHIV